MPNHRAASTKTSTKITCPNDGSTNIHWRISHQKFYCESCHQEFDHVRPAVSDHIATFNGIPVDAKISADLEVPDHIAQYKCPSCGATVILDTKTSMGARCSWCKHQLVMDKVIDTEFTPNGIIPFAITKEAALKTFRSWLRRHWFVHRSFASKDSDIEIKPIYYPFYAMDRDAHYDITAIGERTHSHRRGDYLIVNHEVFELRTPSMAFVDDFEAISLTAIKDKLIINSIEPYDWTKVRAFDYAYLNSFASEHRDISLPTIKSEIDKKLTALIYADIANDLSRATRLERIRINHHEGHTKDAIAYCLAPAWLITYTDPKAKRIYFFAVNGQTGKTSGILPISYQKLALFFIILTAIISVIASALNILYLSSASGGNL